VPLSKLYPDICLKTEEKHGKPQSGLAANVTLVAAWNWPSFRGSLDWPAERQPSSVTRG
jgi:hypothetical protein